MNERLKSWMAKPALVGAGLTVLCGLVLWGTRMGEAWENASYDALFCCGVRTATNHVVLVRMDNESYQSLGQDRQRYWDRALHAELLDKLTADGARLVVFDVLFRATNNVLTDGRLAEAIRRNGRVVLMADVADGSHPTVDGAGVVRPTEMFYDAAAGWGVGRADVQTGGVARRHWPFYGPGEGEIHSLGWAGASAVGAHLDRRMENQWLRYYGKAGPGASVPYYLALAKPPGYFKDAIVFIGSWPSRPGDPGFREPGNDKFSTPYTRWGGEAVGGMEIMALTLANLVNGDWLRRPPAWAEVLVLILTGAALGAGLWQLRPLWSLAMAVGVALAMFLGFAALGYFTNYWFPWLEIAGGQAPFALAWSWAGKSRQVTLFRERFPGYTPAGEPFGEGSYGKVWRVRDATGQWLALKEISRAKFADAGPYDCEFRGIQNYKPLSNQHPGLLHIDHVNRNDEEGYFYYAMELGDALDPAWESAGKPYQPRDLASVCGLVEGGRLPARECFRIGIALLEALEFLHEQGMVHRDIKPSNIIFVNGLPKLADVGLVRTAVDTRGEPGTFVGTEFYMPPPPEPPGTRAADIYALGKVLYVISTGTSVKSFPQLSPTLVVQPEFMKLNRIICRACQPAADERYASATAMLAAMRAARQELDSGAPSAR